jgi:Cof subfamily protein (haloacid dehalogenase superfamily)
MTTDIRIIFTDLDGTLLTSQKNISPADNACLQQLKERDIIRVIATGRSLYSFKKVFDSTVPADYLIFSTGAGIIDLHDETLLYAANLEKQDLQSIAAYLQDHRVDFMVHDSVPHNHRFIYSGNRHSNSDFERRIQLYSSHATPYTSLDALPSQGAQIIAIFHDNLQHFTQVREGLDKYQVTRTTSPLDGKSIWMEIFPPHISKGKSAAWLCDFLQIAPQAALGIGNDYNDVSLLEFSGQSYLVANAPTELHGDYRVSPSNDHDGFSYAVRQVLDG